MSRLVQYAEKKEKKKREPKVVQAMSGLEFQEKLMEKQMNQYRKQFRDNMASVALPITLRNFGTLEGATEAAYKVADLMLIESDKFKP